MARKPKLVPVVALVPTYLKDELKIVAKNHRRTLSAYIAGLLAEWYKENYKPKGIYEHGTSEEKSSS